MEKLFDVNLGNLKFELWVGDITEFKSDAIVNPANKYLYHGGGAAYAIAKKAAGDADKYTELSRKIMMEEGKSSIDYGEVVVTPALNLEKFGIKYVIHTVGPRCNGEWNEDYREKLVKALTSPLEKAEELGLSSIAFPAVSAGIYGCPIEEVAKALYECVRDFSKNAKNIKRVCFVIYDKAQAEQVKEVFESNLIN